MIILVLHHDLKRWAEDTSLELINEMVDLMVVFGLLWYMWIIKAKLSLANDDISIPEVH